MEWINESPWKESIPIVIPAVISIIGIAVNVYMINRSVKNAIITKQKNLNLEKMVEVPYLLAEIYDAMLRSKDMKSAKKGRAEEELLKKLQNIHALILAYGSEEAIWITGMMQQFYYKESNGTGMEGIVYLPILSFQIKYDLTGTKCSPQAWYMVRLTDWSTKKDELKKLHNGLVDEMKLKEFLKI